MVISPEIFALVWQCANDLEDVARRLTKIYDESFSYEEILDIYAHLKKQGVKLKPLVFLQRSLTYTTLCNPSIN